MRDAETAQAQRVLLLIHLAEQGALVHELAEVVRGRGVEVVCREIERLPIADPLAHLLASCAEQADMVAVVVPSRHRNVDWLVRELEMQNRMREPQKRSARFVAIVIGSQRTWRMLVSQVVLELRRATELSRLVDALTDWLE